MAEAAEELALKNKAAGLEMEKANTAASPEEGSGRRRGRRNRRSKSSGASQDSSGDLSGSGGVGGPVTAMTPLPKEHSSDLWSAQQVVDFRKEVADYRTLVHETYTKITEDATQEVAELTSDLRLRELVLEAQLALPISCGGAEGNVLVVDVTDPQVPFVAPGGVLDLVTSDRNHRTLLPVDVPLEAGRSYRLVARVSRIRPGAGAPVAHDELTYTGSVSFPHPGSCPVAEAAAAALDVGERTLTVRYSRR